MNKLPLFFRSLSYYRYLCTATQERASLKFRYRRRPRNSDNAKALRDSLGYSHDQAYRILSKNPVLGSIDHERILEAAKVLTVCMEEIREFPLVLSILPITIEHRSLLLQESGFPVISARAVFSYMSIVRREISLLKIHRVLPKDANVGRNLLTTLQAPESVCQTVESIIDINSDENTISNLRDTILKCYLEWRLDASREEIDYIFSTYTRVLHKSLQLIRRTLFILLNELNFPKEHVTKNGFLIQAHPDDLRKIIDNVPFLAGKPIRDVMYAHPGMGIATYENFMEIVTALREAGIPDESIIRNQNLFHFTGECIKKRLPSVDPKQMAPEVAAFMTEEKIVQALIHYENFFHRLTFLSEQQVSSSLSQIASLSTLVGEQKFFEEFIKGVGSQSQGHGTVNYLVRCLNEISGNDLNIKPTDVRALLKKNPNWRHVPLLEIKQCFEMLRDVGYEAKEFLSALTIVLYPSKMVKDLLEKLSSQPEISECFELHGLLENSFQTEGHDSVAEVRDHSSMSPSDKAYLIHKYSLQLCVYYLEKDHNFSGDGVWFRDKS